MKFCFAFFLIFSSLKTSAQLATLKIAYPEKDDLTVSANRQWISGTVCKTCTLTANGVAVKVYKTGSFAQEIRLNAKDSAVTVISSNGDKTTERKIRFRYSPPSPPAPPSLTAPANKIDSVSQGTVCITKGRLAHLLFGTGDDRLGGAKMGYIDSLIPLRIIGKRGTDFQVQLTSARTAFIPEETVSLIPRFGPIPAALTDRIEFSGDSSYDYVTLALNGRKPYLSSQETDPSWIYVDVFGTVSNTNWVNDLGSAKEIEDVRWEQIDEEVFRLKIKLKHAQHWGHRIYYRANKLIVRVKRPPLTKTLRGLNVALDAGHGGSNIGGAGLSGVAEKQITLQLSLKLQQALLQEGATVTMTRTTETFVDNKERILLYRDNEPDLLLSIHLNSAADPFTRGTATLYRYPGFRSLNEKIHARMLELGLSDYGLISSFNFMLNSPTEYPNCLIEALFLSNPAEEEQILDPAFQDQMVLKIIQGLKDFLNGAERD